MENGTENREEYSTGCSPLFFAASRQVNNAEIIDDEIHVPEVH